MQNFSELITNSNFQRFFLNSVIVTLCVVVISMAISIFAAFSLARIGFLGSQFLATGVFLTYLIPGSLLFIPLFQIVGALELINNVWCLVLIYPTLAVPFCTWIMIGYFSSIPKELDEAALIDGASYPQILFRIFIPVAMPGIIAATIFAFTVSWGQFLYPMAYLYTSDQMVLTVGIITELIRGDVFQWGKIMAGCVLAAAPPVIVYAFLMVTTSPALRPERRRASGLRHEQSAARNRFAPLQRARTRMWRDLLGGEAHSAHAMERRLWRALRSFPGRPV